MNKCMNEERRDYFIHFTSSIESLTSRGVDERQLHSLDSRKVGTPLFISSLNGPMDMRGPKSWHTDKMIELNTLNYGVIWHPRTIISMWSIIETHNLNIVYEFPIRLFSKSLIFKLPYKKK